MKVCLIYDFLSEFGGLERLMVNHAAMLKDAGFEVEIATCYIDKEVLRKMEFGGLKVINISSIKSRFEALNLFLCYLGFNNIREIKPDIFISYSFPSNFIIRKEAAKKVDYINHFPHFLYFNTKDKLEWAKSTVGIKRYIAVIGSFFIGGFLKKLDKKLVNQNILKFVNSKFIKKSLDRLYSMNSVVCYPNLDKIFKPSKKIIKEDFIFSSSRIVPGKKYEWLIKSVSLMKNKIPLFISGQGQPGYVNKLKKLAKSYGADVRFLGKLNSEELVRYYSSAKVFAFPTPNFEFGLVPAESLACGTPVVVWGDGAGPTEQIIDGVNGFYAKPYDLKDFAAKIDKVIESKIKIKNRKEIINSGKKFSFAEVKKGFLREFNKALFSGSLSPTNRS